MLVTVRRRQIGQSTDAGARPKDLMGIELVYVVGLLHGAWLSGCGDTLCWA